MSSAIPPPPPPQNSSQVSMDIKNPITKVHLDECLWAASASQFELQKACYLARICKQSGPKICRYYDIKGITQEGPTCGLTAISMIFNGNVTTAQLLAEAKQLHYTNNGEMFSAKNLYNLLLKHLPKSVDSTHSNDREQLEVCAKEFNAKETINCQMFEGQLNCAKVKEALINGAYILVPYDTDYIHRPCVKRGHKAHWALIIGYLITENDEFFVVARHGKAINLCIWPLEDLSESNSNLWEFAQPRIHPDLLFLLPEGGLAGSHGLRERAIVIGPGMHHTVCSWP